VKISIIGTGYVGLVSGTCLAEIGHQVSCIDVVKEKIDLLNTGVSPIYEPGLEELIKRNAKNESLLFSTNYESVKDSDAIFLAVGTPSNEKGEANLEYLKSAAVSVAENLKEDALVIIKSTVPVGTSLEIEKLIRSYTDKPFHLISNPEFLKEGSAVEDFMRPDRVIVGHANPLAAKVMEEIYSPLVRQGNPIIFMSNLSAEMSKYAANCFLATKISFINEVARLCDLTGADVEEVRKGMASDNRIGGQFLYPGPGYGGSCFPKDVKALIQTAKKHDMEFEIVQASESVNKKQKLRIFEKIYKHFKGDLKGKIFSFWGVAFKANTDDVRESSSIDLAHALIKSGATVHFYDPVAGENFLQEMSRYGHSPVPFDSKYDCLNNSSGLITVTEWREFKIPDFGEIKKRLKYPAIFDARNLFSTEKVLDEDFLYFAIGKKIPHQNIDLGGKKEYLSPIN
jgi:UDPglucose 6-dehydrogenase